MRLTPRSAGIDSHTRFGWHRIAVAIVAVLLSQLLLVGPATAKSRLMFGVSEPDAWRHNPAHASPSEIAGLVSDMGASSHEFWVHWDTVEPAPPVNGVHTYNFQPYDAMYQADLARNIKPMITVQSSPSWTWQSGLTNTWLPEQPPTSEHYGDWRAFLAALAKRYPKAVGIQIWNEPNLAAFWGLWDPLAPTDPAAYTELLKQAYYGIKGASPWMPVIGGAIDNDQVTGGGNISEPDFTSAILARGAARYMDAISVHPYPNIPSDIYFLQGLNQIRSAMSAAGVRKPIWITEVGITTTGPTAVTEQQQADVLVGFLQQVKQMSDVAAFYVHNLTEPTQDPNSPDMGWGLVRGQGVGSGFPRKPAFLALKQAAG